MTTKIVPVPSAESPPIAFEEGFLPSDGGPAIFQRIAQMHVPVRAEVVLTHGLGEHSGRYGHVARAFAERGLRTRAYDLHGHGRSAGLRGDAPDYQVFLNDLETVLAAVPAEGRPVFLMGHSFGAQVTLNYLLRRSCACRGAIIASPWLRLAFRPPFWKVGLAHLMLHFWPAFRQKTPHDQRKLSRDLAHLGGLPGKELMHRQLSARLYFTMVREGAAALESAPKFHLPLLLLHGGDDPVTSMAATKEFFDSAGSEDKSFTVYPEARHETHNDFGREKVIRDMASWIEARA